MNTINDPLKLTFNQSQFEYKVNKPEEQSGEYVDRSIALQLLDELQKANRIIQVLLNSIPDGQKPSIARRLEREGVSGEGMTRSYERERLISVALGQSPKQ